ncbi:10805_t:CDS:2 [Funneliformis geosporum]|uniref:10805_t:CDS:1 n=1 Tax=Funneliformis geosporum TaxID=1117311 RepID=A0A9W4SQ76_9GLOM|nr:10805_t:CDS:2 [Funneliformis geosporum]
MAKNILSNKEAIAIKTKNDVKKEKLDKSHELKKERLKIEQERLAYKKEHKKKRIKIEYDLKSSQVFDDSDNESNNSDSEEELLNAEDDEIILLGLYTLLDSHYLELRFRSNITKSQE